MFLGCLTRAFCVFFNKGDCVKIQMFDYPGTQRSQTVPKAVDSDSAGILFVVCFFGGHAVMQFSSVLQSVTGFQRGSGQARDVCARAAACSAMLRHAAPSHF